MMWLMARRRGLPRNEFVPSSYGTLTSVSLLDRCVLAFERWPEHRLLDMNQNARMRCRWKWSCDARRQNAARRLYVPSMCLDRRSASRPASTNARTDNIL